MVILPEKVEHGSGSGQQSPASTGSVHIADNSGGSRRHQKASHQSVISKGADLCVSFTSSATYADIAAGRNSPCPLVEQVEEKDDRMKHLPRKTVITRTVMEIKDIPEKDVITEISGDTKFEDVSRKDDEPTSIKVQELKTHVQSSDKVQDMGELLTKSTTGLRSEEVQSVGPQTASAVSRGEKSRPSRRGRSQQRKDAQERKNSDKLHSQNLKKQSDTLASSCVKTEVRDEVRSCEEAQSPHSLTTKVTISEHTPVHKKHHHIVLKQPQETLKPQVYRGRSPSPMWNPGSTSYADILRGRQVSEGQEETVAVTDHHELNTPITEENDVNERKVQETYGDKYHYQQEEWSLPDSHKAVASSQQTEEIYVSPVEESPIQNVDTYDMDQTTRIRDVMENVEPDDIVDSETFLQEEVIPSVHEHDVSGVAVPPGMFEYIQQPPPDLVGFIASGQQLLNSGLGTYHTSSQQYVMSHDGEQSLVYPVTVNAAQQSDSQYETLSLDSSHYVQPSIESVAVYTTQVHQDFVPQQYDVSQQAVLSDQDIASSPEVTPVHDTRHSKKVRSDHHSQTEMTASINTAVADEEIKPVTIHQIESDHQTGSIDGVHTEGDKCHLSYAQILAQGLCAKPLQPSSQAVNLSAKRNDRSQSPRPTSPISSYAREWSASPSRDIPPTVREEVAKSVLASDTTNISRLENRAVRKKKDKMKKEADGSAQVCSSPSGDQQKHKCGKIKQKKKQTVYTGFEFNGKQDPINENKEHDPVVEMEATAVTNSGEPLTVTFCTQPVTNNSLASMKDRKGGYKKSKQSDDGKKQNIDSKPVSQMSPQKNEITETKESNTTETEMPEQLQIIDDKQDGVTDQEKKKQQKKKKLVKHTDEDEIEKAIKEIARMEMIFSKQKTKNVEVSQESKTEVMKQEKEDKKSKKTKTLAHADNANELIHEAEPKQLAVVASSVETATIMEGTDSHESIMKLQETKDKNTEICNSAGTKKNENTEILKVEQSKKKKKRGKKTVCNIYSSIQPVEETEIQNSGKGVEYEIDIRSRQNIFLTQKLEPFSEKQLEVTEATNLVEAEPVDLKEKVPEHLQDGNTTAVCKSSRTPQFDHTQIPTQESCIRPPDLLADIKQETKFLKTAVFESGVDSAFPVDVDFKEKEAEHRIISKDEELGETSSPLPSRGKRVSKKQKNAAKLPKEEILKNDAASFMIEKSRTTLGSIPLDKQHALEITSSHLGSITVEDKTGDSQEDKIHEQLKKTSGPEVGVQSPIKGNKKRRGAKKGTSEQCEATQCPKQKAVGSSLTSELDKLGNGGDATSDDIPLKKSTDVTDSSNKETVFITKLNGIQDMDISKIKRNPKKSRKGKQAKIEDKGKPLTEKQHVMEQKPDTNEHEKNCKQVPQETSDKSAELLTATYNKPLDKPAEYITSASGLRLGNSDTGIVNVVTSDLTTKGKSKKSRKSKSANMKATEEHSKIWEDASQSQTINIVLKGAESVTKIDGTDSELPSNKGKRSYKKSKKHKATECRQNMSSVHMEDAGMVTNGSKGPEIVKDDITVPLEGIITNMDNIHALKQPDQTVEKSKKSNKKSKKLKCGDDKDEHLSTRMHQNVLVTENVEDLPILGIKSEPEAQVSESVEKQIPSISGDIEDQGAYQCMEVFAETGSVQAQKTVAALPEEEEAHSEGSVKVEENRDVKCTYVPETSVLKYEVHEDSSENFKEQDTEIFGSTLAQKELTVLKDDKFGSERGETDYKSEPEHREVHDDDENLESQNNVVSKIISVSDQKDLFDKTDKIQEEKGEDQISPEENVFLDAVPKLKRHDTKKKVRCTTNVQPADQVNFPHINDNETGYVGFTPPFLCSLLESKKQIPGTPLVPHGTLHLPENQEDIFFTQQWIKESSVLHNLSSEDSSTLSQSVICDLLDPSVSDISHIIQDTNQNQGGDSPLTPSAVSLPQSQVTLPESAAVISDSGLAQESVGPQEEDTVIELPGTENVGIFGSVKERTRKPRKIIDSMTVDEKAVKLMEMSSPSMQEKKRKPRKLSAKEDIKKCDVKVKVAEEPKELEEHEEYKVMKDKMKKKKKRPKIPTEFTSLQTKVENDPQNENVQSELETVSPATEVDSFELQNIMKNDIKTESKTASAYLQSLSPVNLLIEEQVDPDTPRMIGDSIVNSEMKPILQDATPVSVPKEKPSTSVRLSDMQLSKTCVGLQEAQLANISQEVGEHHQAACMMKLDEFSDAWMNALDESVVFASCDEENDGNNIVHSHFARNETDDGLTKIQDVVIAAVESVCDVLSETNLEAETVTAVTSGMLSHPGLKTETIPVAENDVLITVGSDMVSESIQKIETVITAESDVLSAPDMKTETITEVAYNVLPESAVKTEPATAVTDNMLPEHGLRSETISAVVNDVLSELSMKTITNTSVVSDGLCEPGLKAQAIATIENDDVLSDLFLKTVAFTTVENSDVLHDSGLKTDTITAVESDVLSEPGMKTEAVTPALNDVLSEAGLKSEKIITVSDDVLSELDLKNETVITVADDVLSETDLKTETLGTIVNDLISEPGQRTESMTKVENDVHFEPHLETETVTTAIEVHAGESLLDNTDATAGFAISPFSEEQSAEKRSVMLTADQSTDSLLDGLEEPVVFENNEYAPEKKFGAETEVSESVTQKPTLHDKDWLENWNLPVADLGTRGVCHNPFTAELIIQDVRPCYYLYRDAEMYWQEKVAQELKKFSFTLSKSEEREGLKHSLEKPVESKEQLPVTVTEQPKLEALLYQGPRSGHIFEVPTYDTHILLDAEKKWHELKALGLLGNQETIPDKPEYTCFLIGNEVMEFTKDHPVQMQMKHPDSLTQIVKGSILPETAMNIFSKSEEEAEIFGSNSILPDSRPHVLSAENISEVEGSFKGKFANVPSQTLGPQGSITSAEDGDAELNFKSQLKPIKGIELSTGHEKERYEPLVNLYKENVWLESSKFLDAERKWRELNSEVLPRELAYEEIRGTGAVDIVKSLESVRNGGISSAELPEQQHTEVMDLRMVQESTDGIPPLQDVSQDLKLKSVSDMPADLTDDIPVSNFVSEYQELKFLSSEVTEELTDNISESQISSAEPGLKPGSEVSKEAIDITQVAPQEPELKSSSDLIKDEMKLILNQGHSAGESYCQYDVVGIHDAEIQYQEQVAFSKQIITGNLSDITTHKEATGLMQGGQDHAQFKEKETVNEGGSVGHSAENSYSDYDMFRLHDAERQYQEQIALKKFVETKTDTFTGVVTPVVANNLGTLDAEVQNCGKKGEIILQTESATETVKTWADVVASKKSDPMQGTNYEEKPCEVLVVNKDTVNELSDLQEPLQSSVRVCVETEKEDSNVPLVKVDSEGFMEFVPKREMRKRKSRSRSRSHCRDGVVPEKPRESVVTAIGVETEETVVKTEESCVSSVTSESSERFSVPLAVDTKSKVGGVELCTGGEVKSSCVITLLKSGKETQKSTRKSEQDGREKEVESIVHSFVREEVLQHNLPLDGAFWPDKWRCHDAECRWQETIAQSLKKPASTNASSEVKSDEPHDRKDDSDGGNSGHSSPGPHVGSGGDGGGIGPSGFTSEQLSADLPGGICSWPDESTYLAGPDILVVCPNRLNMNDDEALLAAEEEHTSRLAHRVAEEVFTDLDDEQEPAFLFYPSNHSTQEVQPSCRKDGSTYIFMVQMKVGDLRKPLFSMCFCCVFLRA
jgi:hypothetical protein